MTDIDKQIESLGYEIRVSDLSCCYIVYENKKQDCGNSPEEKTKMTVHVSHPCTQRTGSR